MDTGLGRDGYSMIGQGKIDSIVATRGEDRREIFEEAAGISKFRYKKAEAERRLDKTENNLVRLRDTLSLLESRVEPLRIQSEKAKAYLEYAEEKKGLEIALWLISLDRSEAAVKEQDDKLNAADAQYNDVNAALAEIQDRSERLYQQQTEAAARIDELRRSISGYDEQAARKAFAGSRLPKAISSITKQPKEYAAKSKSCSGQKGNRIRDRKQKDLT